MDKELLQELRELLREELEPIKKDIKDLKQGQEDIKIAIQELEPKNANRHVEIAEELKKINIKLDELKELKEVTKENCYDIAKLKAIK
jgi:hypothetical protein